MPHVATEGAERAAFAAALVIAPALLASGWLLQPDVSGGAAAELRQIAAEAGRWRLSAVLLAMGALVAVPAAVALAAPVRRRSQVGALSGLLLTALGAIGVVAHSALRGLHGARLGEHARDPRLAPGAEAAWGGLLSGATRILVYAPEILGAGLVVLGLAHLWRAPWARHAGAAVALGGALVVAGASAGAPAAAGIGALAVLAGTAAVAAVSR